MDISATKNSQSNDLPSLVTPLRRGREGSGDTATEFVALCSESCAPIRLLHSHGSTLVT